MLNLLAPRRATLSALALCAGLLAGCGADDFQAPGLPPNADAVPGPGLYVIPPGATPDGTLRLSVTRGAAIARGRIYMDGQNFDISIAGLTATGSRATRVDVVGEAYGIGRNNQFPGSYRPVGSVADSGSSGGLNMANDQLVVLRLRPARPGPVLNAAPDGLTVTLTSAGR